MFIRKTKKVYMQLQQVSLQLQRDGRSSPTPQQKVRLDAFFKRIQSRIERYRLILSVVRDDNFRIYLIQQYILYDEERNQLEKTLQFFHRKMSEGGGDGGGGGGYIIRAGGPNFVLLMHEIIKGLYDYLAVDVGEAKLEDLRAERLHTNAGPGIAKIFRDRFLKVAEGNIDDLQYFPFVLRLLYGCDPETEIYDQDLKDIVSGRHAGMQILKDCLDKVKQFYLNGDEIDDNTGDNIGDDTDNDTGDDWKNG